MSTCYYNNWSIEKEDYLNAMQFKFVPLIKKIFSWSKSLFSHVNIIYVNVVFLLCGYIEEKIVYSLVVVEENIKIISVDHEKEKGHPVQFNLTSQRIWCYVCNEEVFQNNDPSFE